MNFILCLLAIFGLAFLIKESDGPWGIIAWLRNKLMKNKYVGVFFYKLFDCYFCVGFHCGWIIYLLSSDKVLWNFFILWGLAGGCFCLIINSLLSKLDN
jgi:hypothetical protein